MDAAYREGDLTPNPPSNPKNRLCSKNRHVVTQTAYVKAAMDEIAAFRPDTTPANAASGRRGAGAAAYGPKREAITGARSLRHTSIDALHDACVDFAAQGSRASAKPRRDPPPTGCPSRIRFPADDHAGDGDEALWTALPQVGSPPAAFTVGQGTTTLTLAGFTALITAARAADGAIPATDQDFQGAEADLHAKQAELEDFVTAALEQGRSQFAEGTPQREIIDAIPNATDGGPGPAPEPPAPPTGHLHAKTAGDLSGRSHRRARRS